MRLACVRYLNTAPLIEGLDALPGLSLVPAVPSAIAPMLARGEADLGLASVIDAARGARAGGSDSGASVPLTIVPCGMIGCDGATLTVRLFSTTPIDRLQSLHADTDSHTSVALARVVLAERFGIRPSVVPFSLDEDAGIGTPASHDAWPAAVLLIGDKVVTAAPPASRYPHQLDLGLAWHEMTGLPFVYAAWQCRAADLEDAQKAAAIARAAAVLDRQRLRNRARLGSIIERRAPARGWPPDMAHRYLGRLLRYGLGEREQQAVRHFVKLAGAHGVIDAGLPVRFFDWRACARASFAGGEGAARGAGGGAGGAVGTAEA